MTTERDKYGIPHPSQPMQIFTPEQEAEAILEAEAEAKLFREQDDDMSQMYNYS